MKITELSIDLKELERLVTNPDPEIRKAVCTPERICAEIAEVFRIRQTEVALLSVQGGFLNFLFPVELRTPGSIPLSSSAVAARTGVTRKAELFNGFAKVKHASVFEAIKLGTPELRTQKEDAQPIQKLMSAPVLNHGGKALGVIQVSRRGSNPASAGPDFTREDLRKLELAGRILGRLMATTSFIAG
jgi:hypothetical protein